MGSGPFRQGREQCVLICNESLPYPMTASPGNRLRRYIMSFPTCLQGRWGGRTMPRRGKATQAGAAIRRRRRAALEFLEDRTLLSIAPQTYVVTNPNDSGAGSLRAAISSANADTYPGSTYDTIQFASSLAWQTINLKAIGAPNPVIGNSALAITRPVHIVGDAAPGLTITWIGTPINRTPPRIFYISAAGNLTLQNLTVSGGYTTYNGGGIYNDGGAVTLTNDTLSGNSTYGGSGGGIYNHGGAATLTNDTLYGNSAINGGIGGGIYNYRGTVTLTNDTLSGNSAYYRVVGYSTTGGIGGGIYNDGGTVTLTNDTVSGNLASDGGGIDNHSGTVTLTNDTLSNNSADYGG